MKFLTPILFALCASVVVSGAHAETWQFAANDVDGNYHTENAKLFARDVEELSDGALTINVVSNAQLLARTEVKRGIQRGIVPIGELLISTLASENNIYAIDSMPFLASNFEDARRLWVASQSVYQADMEKSGLMILWATPWPGQGLYLDKALTSMDDLKAIRIRAPSSVSARFTELMGGVPTTIPSSEVSQAFTTGVVEGMITSPTTGVDTQAWNYVSNFYDMNAMTPKNFILVNRSVFDGLPAEVQAAVREAAAKAEVRGWEMAEKAQNDQVETLRMHGMDVQNTPEAVAGSLAAIGTRMLDELIASGTPGLEEIVTAYRQ